MKRWSKPTTILLFLGALAAALACAGDAAAEDQVLYLDLRTAVELAHANNVELKLAELELEKARLGLEQVRAMSLIEPSPTLQLQAEAGVTLAERSLSLTKQRIAFDVEEAYYNVLRLQNMLAVLDEAEQMARRQLEVAESRRSAGVATDIDVLKAGTALLQTQADKAQAEDSLVLVLARFRQILGLEADVDIVLDETVVTRELVDMTLEQAVAEALSNRLELTQVRIGVEVAEKELALATNDYTPELTRLQAELELQQARLRARQARDGIALDVQNAYNNMQDAYRRLAVAQQRLAEMEEQWRVVQALFDARMATDVELLQGQTGLAEARTSAVNAVFDYNIARAKFFQAIARELDDR